MKKSLLVSDLTYQKVKRYQDALKAHENSLCAAGLTVENDKGISIADTRHKIADAFYDSSIYRNLTEKFNFQVTKDTISGVDV